MSSILIRAMNFQIVEYQVKCTNPECNNEDVVYCKDLHAAANLLRLLGWAYLKGEYYCKECTRTIMEKDRITIMPYSSLGFLVWCVTPGCTSTQQINTAFYVDAKKELNELKWTNHNDMWKCPKCSKEDKGE